MGPPQLWPIVPLFDCNGYKRQPWLHCLECQYSSTDGLEWHWTLINGPKRLDTLFIGWQGKNKVKSVLAAPLSSPMIGRVNSLSTRNPFRITSCLKQWSEASLHSSTPSCHDRTVRHESDGLSRCVASVRQPVSRHHKLLDAINRGSAHECCTFPSPPSTTRLAGQRKVVIQLLLVGPYHRCTIRQWIFSPTSPSGLPYADASLQ